MERVEKMAIIERVIEKYLKRYEDEAISAIEMYCCPSCPFKSEGCSPCEEMEQIILNAEECIAIDKAVLN